MMDIERNIAGNLFSLKCEECLSNQADALFEIISNIEINKLKDGLKIQVGWNIFTIVEYEEKFSIVAPDYKKNPFIDNTEDLSLALLIQLEQGVFLHKLNLDGEMISFQDKIVCAKGALLLDDIYLERSVEYEKGDSGWYVGPVDNAISVNEFEAYYVYQLLGVRPSIVKSLVLPNGYMTVWHKEELKAVLDEKDKDILI